jgi:hypothetical protein
MFQIGGKGAIMAVQPAPSSAVSMLMGFGKMGLALTAAEGMD